MDNLLDVLKQTNKDITEKLSEYLVPSDNPENPVIEAMRYSSLDAGKRLRPLLVMQSAGLFDVKKEHALGVAAAIEMIHCYSLIHDDLPAMDDDKLRRGKPTCHIQFDEATAILAGDGLLTKAFEVLSSEKTNPDAVVRCNLISALSKAAGEMVLGQTIDMLPPEQKHNSLDFIARLQKFKTGALIRFACLSGAIMANASERDFTNLTIYADNLGLAFQITDDILDIEGDVNIVGKTLGKDVEANKATFVSVLGLEGAKQKAAELIAHAKEIISVYGDKANTLKQIADFVLTRNY